MDRKDGSKISQKPSSLRIFGAKGKPERVDRENGIIHGYSTIQYGEALGHELWIDKEFIASVVAGGNAFENGVKSRLAHPGLSADGIGTALGRSKGFRVGDYGRKAFADLHFVKAASNSPNGDLSGYVMDLAEEDPELFGASIVYEADLGAEDEFVALHKDKDGRFKSPDKHNVMNYPHARLALLKGSDIVDEPAANADGFFSDGNEVPARAEKILEYVFGLESEEPPALVAGPHPQRIRQFVHGFLERHGICLLNIGDKQREGNILFDDIEALTKEVEATLEVSHDPNENRFKLIQLELEQLKNLIAEVRAGSGSA